MKRFFVTVGRLANVAEGAARALFYSGVGTLRFGDLHDLLEHGAGSYASSDEAALSGLTPWEESVYGAVVRPGDRLGIIGCGSGRDLLPWVALGHDVIGIDPSAEPVAHLRQLLQNRGQRALILESRIEDATLPGPLDVLLFTYQGYSLIPGRARRVRALRNISRALSANGRICLSYATRRANWINRSLRFAWLAGALTRSDWRAEPYDVFQWRTDAGRPAIGFSHHFTGEEVEREAAEAELRAEIHRADDPDPFVVLVRR